MRRSPYSVHCANKGGLGWLVLTLECILRDSQFRTSGHELIASQYSIGFIYFNLIGSKCYHWSGPRCKNLIWINFIWNRNWFNDRMPNRHWQQIPVRILHASRSHTNTYVWEPPSRCFAEPLTTFRWLLLTHRWQGPVVETAVTGTATRALARTPIGAQDRGCELNSCQCLE